MSVLSKTNSGNMGTPSFHEFKKQASFFLKEKIKTARLALTDVTPAELLTEEVTNGNPWAPDTPTLSSISKAAFEVEDYWRIVEILHKRLQKFEKKNWRVSYNSLIVLEHLLTHGPESVAEEFQSDKQVLNQMDNFQYVDETGFNWGLTVRKKSERIVKMLEKGPLLKEEREKARKLTRGIQGFGSFSQRSSSSTGILQEPSSFTKYGRSHSHSTNNEHCKTDSHTNYIRSLSSHHDSILNKTGDSVNNQMHDKSEASLKENMAPKEEKKPLLGGSKSENTLVISNEDDHPFNVTENEATASLL